MLGWRGTQKSLVPHPSFGVFAHAELDAMTEGLSAPDYRMLLWGVRIYHRAVLEMSDGSNDGS
jgi:hypothetical protein